MAHSRRILISATALLAVACSQKTSTPVDPNAGRARINFQQHASSAQTAAVPAICATFEITPFSVAADGTTTLAGASTTVQSGSAGTAAILGCIDNPAASPDWRYVVTASNFAGCSSPVSGISPSVQTFTVDIDCKAGLDVEAQITANVEIPVPNDAGYIDVSVGVNVSTPQAGCKQADVDDNGYLHFGQSYLVTNGGPTPSAYTGIGLFPFKSGNPATGVGTPAGTLQQFEGTVHDATQTDAFFTGLLQMPPKGQTVTLVQAFTQPCGGQMTIQPHAVECVTQAQTDQASTQVHIADVFADWPGRASVSASVTSAATVSLETSLGGPHLGTITPGATGHDDLTHTQDLNLTPARALSVFGSLLHADELFVITQDPVLGVAVVALALDETTGLWSASAPRALASFTLAQQTAMGLWGQGGCFDAPIPACAPQAGQKDRGAADQSLTSAPHGTPPPPAASGTVTLSFTHAYTGLPPVDAAHPLFTTNTSNGIDPMIVHLQWSVAGINPGDYAYAAVTLCDPFGGVSSNTNGGTKINIGSCLDGNSNTQPLGNALAFPPIQADGSGGVSENLQFTIHTANWVTPDSMTSWTLPVTLFTTSSPTPADGDTQVPVVGPSSGTVPLFEPHDAETRIDIQSATSVAAGAVTLQDGSVNAVPGLVYKYRYIVGTTPGNVGYVSDFLGGHSTFRLLPPSFTDPALAPQLVQGSVVTLNDGTGFNGLTAAVARYGINSNLSISVAADGIPSGDIDNLIGYSSNSGPQFNASWFAPKPSLPNTVLHSQGAITWNASSGATDYNGSGFVNTNTSAIDVSPIPVASLQPTITHTCGDTGRAPCFWPYDFSGVYELYARAFGGIATYFNPIYVYKIAAGEHISSTSIFINVPAGTNVLTSTDPACDGPGSGSGFTAVANPAGPADFSAVRCVRYEFQGIQFGAPAILPLNVQLDASITAGAPVNATVTHTPTFWITADNVIADASGNVWASDTDSAVWTNSTLIDILNTTPAQTVGVDTTLTAFYQGRVVGLPVPDLQVTVTIAPGAVYDLTTNPDTWFVTKPKDVNGATAAVSCDPVSPVTSRVLHCTLTSPTAGVLISGSNNEGLAYLAVKFKFVPSESFDGELAPRTYTISTSASWLVDDQGAFGQRTTSTSDRVIGPNQLAIGKSPHGGITTANGGATVPFDLSFGALGLNSGALGAGGVAVYDFFGKDFVPGANGAAGTLTAQSQGCVAPVPVSVSYSGSTGGTSSPAAPSFFYTTDATPDTTASTVWTAMSAGAIPAGATAIKIAPNSSLGGAGVLLPIDGTETVQVSMASAAGATGKLCNSAALGANGFNATGTSEAVVTLTLPCAQSPWP